MKAAVSLLLLLAAFTTLSTCLSQEYEAVAFKSKKTKGDDTSTVILNDKKSWMEWNANVATAGEYTLTFRHSNLITASMEVVLNKNAVISLDFGVQGTTTTAPLPLQTGLNIIILRPIGNAETNVDKKMIVASTGVQDDSGGDDSDPQDNSVKVLYSTGSTDHTWLIQNTLNSLSPNDTLHLFGDFVIFRTIYFPSDFTWQLDGTLTLGKNAVLDIIGWRPAAITEKSGGASNIRMVGGLYDGNRKNNGEGIRLINFVKVTNSIFRDMVINNAPDDNFSLGLSAQYNEVYNLLSRYAGGNGLSDKGSYNKWFDCVAEYCDSDGWTPKSQYSEFHRCVARENKGPGFGMYARTDVPDVNIGAKLNGNKFIEIEAYCNERSGISLNIADDCGPGAELMDNYIQGYFYKNGRGGVEFTNKLSDGKIINNSMDVVALDNYGWSPSTLLGGISVKVAGLAVPGMYGVADQVTGYFVGYRNNMSNRTDVNIQEATNSEMMVFQTNPLPQVVGNANWQPSAITCPAQPTDEWRVRKYCEKKFQPPTCVTKWT